MVSAISMLVASKKDEQKAKSVLRKLAISQKILVSQKFGGRRVIVT